MLLKFRENQEEFEVYIGCSYTLFAHQMQSILISETQRKNVLRQVDEKHAPFVC